MRADRLVQLLLLLQRRPVVTAAEAAAELEVSTRTARRDFEALAMAGVPVYSSAGRGGGWRLLGGATTDLSGLTEAEAHSLVRMTAGATGADGRLRAALHKVINALPEPFQSDAETATSSVLVDPAGWGHTTTGRPPPANLDAVTSAVFARRRLELAYINGRGEPSSPVVDPFGVVEKRGTWYLVARPDRPDDQSGADGLRAYRIDRIAAAVPTGDRVDRPADFDLGVAWRAINDAFAANTLSVTARGVARPGPGFSGLRAVLGSRLQVLGPTDDGRVEVEITSWGVHSLAAEIAGFADSLEITSPTEVRTRLGDLAATLGRIYARCSPGESGDQLSAHDRAGLGGAESVALQEVNT